MIGPRGSTCPSSPGSATSAGVSMTPMTRRQPATAFCSSLRISVACCTGWVNRLTRKRNASSSPRVSCAVRRRGRCRRRARRRVVSPETSCPEVNATTDRACAPIAALRCASMAASMRCGGALLDAVGPDGRGADDGLGDGAEQVADALAHPGVGRGRRSPWKRADDEEQRHEAEPDDGGQRRAVDDHQHRGDGDLAEADTISMSPPNCTNMRDRVDVARSRGRPATRAARCSG